MGYFDALTSSYFKTAADGRNLFYPWGVLGRGYVIATEQDRQRLLRQLKIYTIVSCVLIVGAAMLQSYMGALVIGLALVLFYVFWARHLVRGDEGLSMRESYTSQALAHSPASLWSMAIGSLVLFVAAIAMLVFEPGSPWVALAGIVFFGLTTAVIGWMLILRRRAGHRRTIH